MFWRIKNPLVLGSLQTSLLCIMELAGGESLAVCLSDSWQVTGDAWQKQVTPVKWNPPPCRFLFTSVRFCHFLSISKVFCPFFVRLCPLLSVAVRLCPFLCVYVRVCLFMSIWGFLVLVLLLHVERFSVSRKRDFWCEIPNITSSASASILLKSRMGSWCQGRCKEGGW